MDKDNNTVSRYILPQNATILEALQVIDAGSKQMAVVCDDSNHLLGIVTDGDIRRAIIHGLNTNTPVVNVMNKSPQIAKPSESRGLLLLRMREKYIHFLPIVNEDNEVIDVVFLSDLTTPTKLKNTVVIMAGGKGTRLGPLTKNCPKPMLKIGGRPILETIVTHLATYGFYDFVISVNYLKDQIVDYFGDGSKYGLNINYLYEDKPLGTAGALSKFQPRNDMPFIVMNGDIYTDMDFIKLMNKHINTEAIATIGLRKYEYQIPYGVIQVDGEQVKDIREKPIIPFFVNGGIYVFTKKVLEMIPNNEYYPMTSLIEKLIKDDKKVGFYNIDSLWIDIGLQDDFKKIQAIF